MSKVRMFPPSHLTCPHTRRTTHAPTLRTLDTTQGAAVPGASHTSNEADRRGPVEPGELREMNALGYGRVEPFSSRHHGRARVEPELLQEENMRCLWAA